MWIFEKNILASFILLLKKAHKIRAWLGYIKLPFPNVLYDFETICRISDIPTSGLDWLHATRKKIINTNIDAGIFSYRYVHVCVKMYTSVSVWFLVCTCKTCAHLSDVYVRACVILCAVAPKAYHNSIAPTAIQLWKTSLQHLLLHDPKLVV